MIVEGQHVSAAIRADRLNKSFVRKQALFGLVLRWPAMTMRPVAYVQESAGIGMAIAEFPITLEATRASHQLGLKVLMGAPNLVRGGSYSGNIAAAELACWISSPATTTRTACCTRPGCSSGGQRL